MLEIKGPKHFYFEFIVNYFSAAFFIIIGVWFLIRVLKKESPIDLSIISPFFDGLILSLMIFLMGVGILMYKIYLEK
jgi:hypothetical protein